MPVNQNVPASEYTQYLRERSTIVSRKWVAPDFSTTFYNSQILYSSIAKRLSPSLPLLDDIDYGGLLFNSGYLNVAPKTSLDLGTGDFTIEWFMNIDSAVTVGIFCIILSPTSKISISMTAGGVLRAGLMSGDNNDFGFTAYLTTNKWSHCFFERSSGVFRLSIENPSIRFTRTVLFPINGASLQIGNDYGPSDNIRYLSGSISNFRVTKGTALYATSYIRPSLPLSATGSSLLLISTARNPYKDSSADSENSIITVVGTAPVRTPGPITLA